MFRYHTAAPIGISTGLRLAEMNAGRKEMTLPLARRLLSAACVRVKRVEDLVVWRLADALRAELIRLTSLGPAARDFRFRDQIREAGESVASNLAEGFDPYNPRDFARFAIYARGSLGEICDRLKDGIARP